MGPVVAWYELNIIMTKSHRHICDVLKCYDTELLDNGRYV